MEATNWNARRFFKKGKCSGVFEDDVDDSDIRQENDDRKKGIVCGIRWMDTTYHELLLYLTVEMYIANGEYTTDREYFTTTSEGLFNAPCLQLRIGLSYRRFLQLKQFFILRKTLPEDVITDPADGRVGKTMSKTHMVDEIVASMQKTFAEFSIPGNTFAIDESMIPWYGKYCPIRVYLKGKLYKYGIKLWQLCDWPDGFLRYFRIYPGRGDRWPWETDEQVNSWTYAERVVLCHVKDLPRGCFFTVDRHFMTPKLAAYLKKEHGQFVTGTMKKNTKNLDKSLLFKKNMKIGRGFYTWSEDQDNGVTQAVWMDREVVPFCSSGFGAEPKPAWRLTSQPDVDDSPEAKRKVKSKRMKPHIWALSIMAPCGQWMFMTSYP